MNVIETIQRKYLPGFYESRYRERKRLALSLKQKCLNNPRELSLYELKIVLKVLQQFGLLDKDVALSQKERLLKTKIGENSVWSAVGALLPYGVREYHRLKTMVKVGTGLLIFCGINYYLMSTYFKDYIGECRKLAQKNISKLLEESQLMMK